VLVAVVATACSAGGSTQGANAPSTIAPGSPWLGTLAAVTLPAPVNSLTSLDCVNSLHCWAVGSSVGAAGAPNGAAVIATANGGTTWTVETVPTTVAYLSGISCSDQHHCTAVGQATSTSNGQGAIITTSDGGATWTAATVPAGVLDVTAITCQRNRRCLATGSTSLGTTVLVASPAQPVWVQRGPLPPTLVGATSITCPDAQHCWVTAHVAVDVDHVAGQVAVTTDGGTTWATTAAPKGAGYLNDIVCARGSGGNGGLPFTSTTVPPTTAPSTTAPSTSPSATASGTTPGSTTTVPPATTAPPPSTTTTTAPAGVPGAWCVAVGTSAATVTGTRTGHGMILTTVNGGTSWSSQVVAPGAATLMGVSCTAVNSCVTVGSAVALEAQAGVAVLTGSPGRPWRKAATVSTPQALTAVSCTSLSRCVMVGESISQHLAGA
jgi:hypothetical protein